MKNIILLLSIIRSIYYNFKCFPIQKAIKLPILIRHNACIKGLNRNTILIPEDVKPFMIRIGFGGSIGVSTLSKNFILIEKGSLLNFLGKARFAIGIQIRIENSSILSIGDQFSSNKNSAIFCSKGILIGENVLFGWNVSIRDSDGHKIKDLETGNYLSEKKDVQIGNNVWVAANVDILKGTTIPDGCIIGYGSKVFHKFIEQNSIIAGYPAKIIRNNVSWEI